MPFGFFNAIIVWSNALSTESFGDTKQLLQLPIESTVPLLLFVNALNSQIELIRPFDVLKIDRWKRIVNSVLAPLLFAVNLNCFGVVGIRSCAGGTCGSLLRMNAIASAEGAPGCLFVSSAKE